MIEINGRQFCENCFEPLTGKTCKSCGFDPSDSAADPSMLSPGSVLANRYVIGKVIGKGGFGITYLAYDALVGKKIAVKEYFPYGLAQRAAGSAEVSVTSSDGAEAFKQGAEKFYNEAKLVSRFNGNPNIVGVYDCFYENSTVYMAMEYLRGCTLKDYIREHGVLGAPKALCAAKSITNALIVAHSASVLHRDITPDNVILCDNGDIKLIDFGAARQVVAELSQTLTAILKPGFAPPEQYSKKGNQGPWTDVYAVGTTLYFMLTGDIPEDPTTRFDDDDTFKENTFDIAPDLWELITKATKLNIDERYPDAYELKKALDAVDIKPEPIITPVEAPNADTGSKSEVSEGISNMRVSIKPPKPKQSFFRRHTRTIIEITCGVLVAAVIIPLAVQVNRLAAVSALNGNTGTGDNSSNSGTVGTIGNRPDLEQEKFSAPVYSCLSGDEKALYEDIFIGVRAHEKNIVVPSNTYKVSEVERMFGLMLNENTYFNDTQGFNLNYIDLNVNKEPDPDEYVNSILPIYTGIEREEANHAIRDFIREERASDIDDLQILCDFYDKLINETQQVARNTDPTASTTHGAVIDHAADDLGIARAICDAAQMLGFDSFVVDTEFPSSYQADARVKIDGEWYNIYTYFSGYMTQSTVFEVPLTSELVITHYWFLFCDGPYTQGAIGMPGDLGEEFSSIMPPSDEETEFPTTNYYIEKHLNKKLYVNWNDSIYDALLADTKEWFDGGKEAPFEFYLMYDYVDEMWKEIKDRYISDLSEKYGITVSGFTGEYTGDAVLIKFET